MLAVIGTVPVKGFPLLAGQVRLEGENIRLEGETVSVGRGTAALLAAACRTAEVLGQPAPHAYLAGDIGRGDGSRRVYSRLTKELPQRDFRVVSFHYLMPVVHWHDRVVAALEQMPRRATWIADAGFMYVAKMSGQAAKYDLFTPDVGELAFLADEQAPHPFFTRGFILHEDNRVPDLIARAYAHANAARSLMVKGRKDYLANAAGIAATVEDPTVAALEAIGGTGDTLTGIVSALVASGMEINRAAAVAFRTNRFAGFHAEPTPATRVLDIIRQIEPALEETLAEPAVA